MHTMHTLHLSTQKVAIIERVLSTDVSSSDEQVISHLVSQGIFHYPATQAVKLRSLYLNNSFSDSHSPLRDGTLSVAAELSLAA